MALVSGAGKAGRRPLGVTSSMKEKRPSLLAVRAKMGDEVTKREGEIDESGRVSLPEANALKSKRRETGEWKRQMGDRSRGPGLGLGLGQEQGGKGRVRMVLSG